MRLPLAVSRTTHPHPFMKNALALAAILAITIGTAAAQQSGPAGSDPKNDPTTTSPNYKPAAGRPGTKAKPKKTSGLGQDVVVRSGGQGHNSTPDPKGKTLIAPSASTTGKKK